MNRLVLSITLTGWLTAWGLAADSPPALSFKAATPEEALAWQQRAREKLFSLLMGGQRPAQGPLDATLLRRIKVPEAGYNLDELSFQSLPDRRAHAWLARPARVNGKAGAVLAIHGHGGKGEDIVRGTGLYWYGRALAEMGFFVIAPDVGQHDLQHTNWSLMGERTWDAIRCLDYVASLPEVDTNRLAVAGLSLGGETTMYVAALDERVRLACSSGWLTTVANMKNGHCPCFNFPGLEENFDFSDIFACAAPRSLVCELGEKESAPGGFPVTIGRQTFNSVRSAYQVFNAESNLVLTVHPGHHVFDGRDFLPKLRAAFVSRSPSLATSSSSNPGVMASAEISSTNIPVKDMTYNQAKQRIPNRTLPRFWIGDVKDISTRLNSLRNARVTVLAHSPGGRPIHQVTFGESEPLPSSANFNSAVGGQDPTAYRDKTARKKPVILFLGPVHGQEVEGLTGLMNLVEIMETGRDLRDRDQSQLQALGQQCHLLIIPAGNPDGIARFEPRALQGLSEIDLLFWGQGTWSDHTFCGWPESKRLHPMAGPKVGFLGCYFNDRGINPMHDEFFDPMSTEALAVIRLARQSAPDMAVSLHSHENRPSVLRPAYLPMEVQQDLGNFARKFYEVLDQRGFPHDRPFEAQPEKGAIPAPFNLTSALYHVSGARSFTFECPHGLTDASACPASMEQILDIQLALYEAMMRYELEKKQ